MAGTAEKNDRPAQERKGELPPPQRQPRLWAGISTDRGLDAPTGAVVLVQAASGTALRAGKVRVRSRGGGPAGPSGACRPLPQGLGNKG
ncbi:hypothetical protein Dshi_0871 [Dinoroseobacter shibae DFL 12 = DSM 16493]|uniref:Uncharacterized protein n=1 Tax=Dinoroseobacter shibae (strain DSM 16493 / NCIMB 14021 / DFL 12) TaxID=398580 RepID=A8LRG6_DINSH|nr:hypothetical protein Dshi_0871 [Dinoroseobacter shibae DFL 12 = DSM 16493]